MGFLHTNGIAHTDIKLDNVQLTLPDEQDAYLDNFCADEKQYLSHTGPGESDKPILVSREVKLDELGFPILCDLGSAMFDDERYSGMVQALPYRAPEVILGAAWDHKIDIWNFGTPLLRHCKASNTDGEQLWELLFNEHLFGDVDERNSIASMIGYLGAPPKDFLESCGRSETFFDTHGEWKYGPIDAITFEDRIKEGTSNPEILDFLRCACEWEPR